MPWVLARSAIETVLLAPLLLAAAGGAFDAATRLLHGVHLPSAWAAVAAAYTAMSFLGPGSRPARRQLHRVLKAFASSPLEVVTTILTLSAIAMIIAALALIQPPSMWPLPDPLTIHFPVPGLNPVSLHG
jgi:K+ transporter